MDDKNRGMIEGLKYAIECTRTLGLGFKTDAYKIAMVDMRIFLEAAIERVKRGEPMGSSSRVMMDIGLVADDWEVREE